MGSIPARIAAVLLGLGSITAPLPAQDGSVPVRVQLSLLARVLGFDRSLPTAAPAELALGVVYQSHYRPSADVADEVRASLANRPATDGAVVLRPVFIDLDQTPDLRAELVRQRVRVIYVSPLRAVDPAAVAAATRSGQVRSVTGVVHYVEIGLAVGIGLKGDRPEIVINLRAARAEGADFAAQLLKLARVLDPKKES